MTFFQCWGWCGLGLWALAGAATALWLVSGPAKGSDRSDRCALLQPVVHGMKRTCWESSTPGQWPLQPRLQMEAEQATMEGLLAGGLQETWYRWHLSWLEPQQAGLVSAVGERGLFEPIHRHFTGQQVMITRRPPLLEKMLDSSTRTDLQHAELEVECAELVLDLGAASYGNARPGTSQPIGR